MTNEEKIALFSKEIEYIEVEDIRCFFILVVVFIYKHKSNL